MKFRLEKILKERAMTQAELASQTGISRNSINALANNPKQIRLETLETLCKVFEIKPNDLFEIPNEKAQA